MKVQSATGWSFECLTDAGQKPIEGGLALKDVRHDRHNFARDIRTVGVWITIEVVDKSGEILFDTPVLYILGSSDFTTSPVRILDPKPIANPLAGKAPGIPKTFMWLKEADTALYFAEYFKDPSGNYVATGVAASYTAPQLFRAFDNCEYLGINMEQIFLFSRYGNDLAHEPSGALNAARCHPLLHYELLKNPAYDEKKSPFSRLVRIRFDYRLHLFLDRHHDTAENAKLRQYGNQAGLFADSDSLGRTVAGVVRKGIPAPWSHSGTFRRGKSYGAFESVEKPLVLEIAAPGLYYGFPRIHGTGTDRSAPALDLHCWDNVHWWGGRGPGEPIISAPGAFHAAHLHWRWGGAIGLGKAGSGGQFNPPTWPAKLLAQGLSAWGPLVDPGIFIQSIGVAITKNDAALDPNQGAKPRDLTKDNWGDLFHGLRAKPTKIVDGEDLVLWYSTEVNRSITVSTHPERGRNDGMPPTKFVTGSAGTVFLHGIFFAHEAEATWFGSIKVGTTDPEYRPRSAKEISDDGEWFRAAD
jgi:hypothetical protein